MMRETMMERDAGFCSGGDDDDMEGEDGIHSPTDASEDSVDVKVQAISLRNKNKRKSAEPRRVDTDLPAKKRKIDLTATEKTEKEVVETRNCSPFRPWSASPSPREVVDSPRYASIRMRAEAEALQPPPPPASTTTPTTPTTTTTTTTTTPGIFVPRLPPSSPSLVRAHDLSGAVRSRYAEAQDEPLSLVSKKKDCETADKEPRTWPAPKDRNPAGSNRARTCKTFSDAKSKSVSDVIKADHGDSKFRIDSLLSSSKADGRLPAAKTSHGGQQRNYKNMTRERRIEANARERTRVHTISAAFDTLRHSIPAYSHNQKLSKLSVLRIACSYIVTLSRLAGHDYSKDQSEPEISNCVENVSKTIQTEGKIRKKKED